MESGIQSSFIPQDAGEEKIAPSRIGGGAGFSELVLLLAIVLVVASGALAGAVFVYKQYMQTSLNSKKEQLQRAKDAFDPSLIQQLTRLDDRMHAGSTILSQHVAPTVFLDALSQATLTTIQFTNMAVDATDFAHVNVKFSGVAQSINSIALQAQVLSKNGVMANPIFSGIQRAADGVHFGLTLEVNPKAIGYEQMITAANPQAQQPAQQQTQQTSPFGGTAGQKPVTPTPTPSPSPSPAQGQ
jgi:hypothetical protein